MKDSISLKWAVAVLGCTVAAASAGADPTRAVVQLGPIALSGSSLYEGVETERALLPLLMVDFGRFYFHGTQGGYRFVDRGGTSVALQVEMGMEGYKAGDSDALEGMRKRRNAIEASVVMTHALTHGQIEMKLSRDVSGTHRGYSARLGYEHYLPASAFGVTSFYVAGEYFDSGKADYYFGVREDEVRAGRDPWVQGSVAAVSGGVQHLYPVNARVTFVGSVGYRAFERDLRSSPIVERSGQIQAHAAFVYGF